MCHVKAIVCKCFISRLWIHVHIIIVNQLYDWLNDIGYKFKNYESILEIQWDCKRKKEYVFLQ